MSKKIPSKIKDFLSYDPNTGEITWLQTVSSKCIVGSIAGALTKPFKGKQYIQIMFEGTNYLAHRIAWFLVTNEQPNIIDHINGIGTNNMWNNLRISTQQQNSCNSKLSSKNSTGFKGVSLTKNKLKFRATITHNYKSINLGVFDTPEEAHIAYCNAANELHKEFANHGTN